MASLTRFEEFLQAPVVTLDCPPAEELAAFILGLIKGNEQLHITAHVRHCPCCQLAISFATPQESKASHESWSQKLKRLVAYPLPATQFGLRGVEHDLHYQAEHVHFVLTQTPHTHEGWQLAGRVLFDSTGQSDWTVIAMTPGRRLRAITDNDGFFVFEQMPAGRYLLSLAGDGMRIHIRDFTLGSETIGI